MEFTPAPLDELLTYDDYLRSLSSPIDSFVESAILGSQFHRISVDSAEVGFFAVKDGTLLTQFHLVRSARRFGQPILDRIFTDHAPTAACVTSCDEFLLSHLLDREHVLERQGYFFAEAVPGRPASTGGPGPVYRYAVPADIPEIRAVSGDFLDLIEDRVAVGEIHVGHADGDLVAVGIAERGRLLKDYASIGMFTHESHRRTGIGTATLLYLRGVCHDEGRTPIAGCWYYNHNSKRTLEAAGMVTATRLFRLEFPAA